MPRPDASSRAGRLIGVVVAGGLSLPAVAGAQPAGARPVEQGIADVGPLSPAGRVAPLDLRTPYGFERVYRLDTVDAFKEGEVFLRMSGGITAVFPRSVYERTPDGARARIAPGTVFYIGKLPERFSPRPAPPAPNALSAPLAVDLSAPTLSARSAAGGEKPAVTPPNPSEAPSMWENEEYRRARLGQVLRRAMLTR